MPRKLGASLHGHCSRFVRNELGNYTVIGALMMVPIVFTVGLTVDYSDASLKKSVYQGALDSAVLATAIAYNSSKNETDAREAGLKHFQENCREPVCGSNALPNIEIIDNKTVLGTISGSTTTGFTSFFNGEKISFGVEAEVNLRGNPKNQDFWFIVDVSASLGIAASNSDMYDLMAETKPYSQSVSYAPDGCAFACHEVTPEAWERTVKVGGKTVPQNTYDWAREEGIALRNDVLEAEFHDALDKILSEVNGTHADRVRAGLMVFSDDLETLTKPTANSTNIKSAYSDSKIGIRRWGSRHDLVLPQAAKAIGKSGAGKDKKDPIKTVVLITDGVTSNYSNFDFKAMNPKNCDAFKENGMKVVVLDIVYPELKYDGIFNSMVAPFYKDISPALEACASPGHYYRNGKDADIAVLLEKLVNESLETEIALKR